MGSHRAAAAQTQQARPPEEAPSAGDIEGHLLSGQERPCVGSLAPQDGTWCLSGLWKRLAPSGAGVHPGAAIVKSVEGGVERGFDVAKLAWGRKRHILVDTLGLSWAVSRGARP